MLGTSTATRPGTLRLSVLEGMLHAIMLGTSESYLGALAVELGHRDRALALLATVPLLAGALSQLASRRLSLWLRSRRMLVLLGALMQAAAVLGFQTIALTADPRLAPFLVTKTLFWMTGSVVAPAWSAWLADLTTPETRARYFAARSAWVSLALVLSFALSGHVLHLAGAAPLSTYADLFLLAFAARTLSALSFLVHAEPHGEGAHVDAGTMGAALRTAEWRTALYMAGLMFAAHVSTPFFTPYMLRTLSLDYGQFALLMSVSIVVKAIAFPLCYPLARRIGMRGLLTLAGLGVASTPLLWYFARDAAQLLWVELFAGAVWAAWEYSSFQLLLSSSRRPHQLTFLAAAGTLTAAAQLTGALLGTWLIEQLGMSYRAVFAASGALRLASLALLLVDPRLLPLGRQPQRITVRLDSIRPNAGAVGRVLTAEPLDDEKVPPGR